MEVSSDHHLKINSNKSSVTLVGNESQRSVACRTLSVKVNNISVPTTNSSKSLGVIIDSNLRFRNHVTNKLKKAYSALRLIYSQRHFLTLDTKKLLCDTLV